MILEKIRTGEITPERSVIIESTSGNLGVGLAQVCRFYDMRLICVVDSNVADDNLALMRAYGAEIEIVKDRDQETGEYLPVRIRRVQELVRELPHAYWPNQYGNQLNSAAQAITMAEITAAARQGGLPFLRDEFLRDPAGLFLLYKKKWARHEDRGGGRVRQRDLRAARRASADPGIRRGDPARPLQRRTR